MKIAIIGAGNMGGATARGLATTGKYDICVSNPSQAKLDALKAEFPAIQTTSDNKVCATGADLVVLCVKPWKIEGVIAELLPALTPEAIVASMAAGITCAELTEMLQAKPSKGFASHSSAVTEWGTKSEGESVAAKPSKGFASRSSAVTEWGTKSEGESVAAKRPVYQVIPNTAIAQCQSMTFITGINTNPDQDSTILSIFDQLGKAMLIEERQMPAGMSLASCGIAYVFRYIRAAMEGGIELGLYPAQAKEIMLQTLKGAVSVLETNNTHPEQEIDRVTTPGGFTVRGLNAMEAHGFTTAVIEGLKASAKK